MVEIPGEFGDGKDIGDSPVEGHDSVVAVLSHDLELASPTTRAGVFRGL